MLDISYQHPNVKHQFLCDDTRGSLAGLAHLSNDNADVIYKVSTLKIKLQYELNSHQYLSS